MLELHALHRFFGDAHVLADVSFTVPSATVVGFVGRNGAGKTTTMRIALGLLAASSGHVTWNGRGVDRALTRRTAGYLPEERGLYPKTPVREQLRYLGRLSGMSARAAGAAADHWIELLGLTERAATPTEELSLGNQQRVQLAAALVHEPALLVLDEPFSGLDPVGVDLLSSVVRQRAAAGAAVLFSSHQLELVERLCDRVVMIDAGRVVADGGVAELRRRRSLVTRLRLEGEGLDATWASGLPGVVAAEQHGDHLVVELGPDGSDVDVLDAARRRGPVRHFSREDPTLADVFKGLVAA